MGKSYYMKRPNIVFIFSDQQRPDTMGCYGQKLPVTPRLDALAADGVRFDMAITCQPVCGPARAALQTGKWATQTGCFINGIPLGTDEKTMAHYMSDAGYEVGYVGKWHLASDKKEQRYETKAIPPELRGGYKDYWMASDVLEFTSHSYDGHMFDGDGNMRVFPENRYRVDAHTDFVLEYLQNRKTDNPFFLFISYIEPHHQNDHNCYEGPHGSKEKYKDYEVPGDLAGTEGDWRENMPDYLGCCNSLDMNVGRIIDELTTQGIMDDTIIIYTCDHGSHFCTRNAEYKRSCHEASVHIPLIIHGPGFTGGQVNNELVSLLDLTPTVLQIGGVEPPAQMVGKPLQKLMNEPHSDWRDAVFIQISEDHIGRAIRTKKWKYSVWVPSDKNWSGAQSPGSDIYVERFLYDLDNDPFERNNLVNDPLLTEIRSQLAEKLKALMVDAGENRPEILPAVN
jgi:uncharacterized sulfatase